MSNPDYYVSWHGWTTLAKAVAGGLQVAFVDDDVAGGFQTSCSSASGL